MKKHRSGSWWLLSAAALALAANAAETPKSNDAQDTVEVTFAGMKVGVDKKTGKLRPLSAEESRQLDAAMARQMRANAKTHPASPVPAPPDEAAAIAAARVLPGGGTAMKLPATHMEYLYATRDANGNLVLSHSGDDPDAVRPTQEAAKEWAHE